jgi:hypothetical protein
MSENDKDFRILMVGASGAGKTSLLTAMYDTLEKEFAAHSCTFTPDPATSGKLDEYRDTLSAYADNDDPDRSIVVSPMEGIEGSKDLRRYRFGVRFLEQGQKAQHDLTIQFDDVPGGWFSSAAGGEEFTNILQRADAMLVAIDATALMHDVPEGDEVGRYHQKFNRPKSIAAALKHAGVGAPGADGTGGRTRAVIYTLTKAETYCQTPQDEDVLRKKAIAAYSELTDYLDARDVPVYITVAQTVGCLRFHRYDVGYDVAHGNVVRPVFRRIVGRKYSPRDCDVPLRLIFGEALEKTLEDHRKGYPDLLNGLIEWLGLRDPLLNLISDVSKLDPKKYQALN